MLNLQIAGYGTREGIPTLVMAASSCDDVLAISLFSVFLGIAFSQGNFLHYSIQFSSQGHIKNNSGAQYVKKFLAKYQNPNTFLTM